MTPEQERAAFAGMGKTPTWSGLTRNQFDQAHTLQLRGLTLSEIAGIIGADIKDVTAALYWSRVADLTEPTSTKQNRAAFAGETDGA